LVKKYSVGEVAKMTGLTRRALQYYDNIGIFKASGRTSSDKRYYLESDLINLQLIVFYRSIGLPIKEIEEKLVNTMDLEKIKDTFYDQLSYLYNQLELVHSKIATLKSSLKIMEVGKQPPWEILLQTMRSMPDLDDLAWNNFFDQSDLDIIGDKTFEEGIAMYQTWKSINIEASAFLSSGIEPGDPIAQKLAKNWWDFIISSTEGNLLMIKTYGKVYENKESWLKGDSEYIEKSNEFLNKALEIYLRNIEVSEELKELLL